MDRQAIMSRALRHGFTLRQQPGGAMDLNECVYAFAQEVFEAGRKAERAAPDPIQCETCGGTGEIGGFQGGAAPGYVTEECPDCAGAGHAKQHEDKFVQALRYIAWESCSYAEAVQCAKKAIEETGAIPTPPCAGHAHQQEIDHPEHALELVGLRPCNGRHGGERRAEPCIYLMRTTDPSCTGCVEQDEDQPAEAGG